MMKHEHMMKYVLYTNVGSDVQEIESHKALLDEVKNKHSIDYEIVDAGKLSDTEKEDLAESIRLVSRKNAIGVVSKGNGALPISRKKNIAQICILLQFEDERLKNVYPHEMNKKRFDIASHLNGLIKADNLSDAIGQESISEKDISKMISTFPELIEPGLEFVDTEVEVDGGRIDAVFKSKDDEYLLIEIEIEAKDIAIGQVQRFITYSEKYEVDREKIRLGIVCAKIPDSRLNACKGAGIEVYTLCLERKA